MFQKLEAALNEARTLILVGQIMLGFQFNAVFQPKFEQLTPALRWLNSGAMALIVAGTGLLLAPVPYHRIVADGNATADTHRFTTRMITAAPLPLAICISLDAFIVQGGPAGAAVAGVLGATALLLWYGIELMKRPRPSAGTAHSTRPASIRQKIKTINTEARIILPGVQALLGFQFTAFLTTGFDHLPEFAKHIHFAGMCALSLSAILLMAPAAYHRIAAGGEDRADVDRFAVRMVLGSMVPLGFGLAADLALALGVVAGWQGWEIPVSVAVLAALFVLWFGYPSLIKAGRHAD